MLVFTNLENEMLVKELIAALQRMDQDAEVHIEEPTYDHWRTHKILPVVDCMEMGTKHSDYHNSLVLDEDSQSMAVTLTARYS